MSRGAHAREGRKRNKGERCTGDGFLDLYFCHFIYVVSFYIFLGLYFWVC